VTLVGATISGRYTLERRIGQGGTADVYRAKDSRLDRTVSIKILNSALANDAEFRNRLKREATAASALAHPGIVRIFDAGEDTVTDARGVSVTHAYIVMEFVQGIELTKVIAKGPLKVAEALRIAKETADAVAFAHKKHIIHRDLTPSNIMITKDGSVKILDFGIAFSLSDSAATQTQALSILGTPAYFSPEQANGSQGDERSDIYSLGVVLYEMLTGRVPFTAATPVDVARAHLDEEAPSPSSLNPKVPVRVDMVVERALSKSPADRFTSAAAFADDIESAFADVTGSSMEQATIDAELPLAPMSPEPLLSPASAHQANDDFDAMFAPRATYSGGESWSVEEMSGLGARNTPQRRRVVGGIAIALVTASVLALVALWVVNLAPTTIFAPSSVVVPKVASLTFEQAATKLRTAELEPVRAEEYSATVEKDKVIRTDPGVGLKLEPGQIVTIYVSLGVKEVPVPNVSGMTLADGQTQLTSLKLVSGSLTETYHGAYPSGTIISTDPVAGTSVKEGATVNFVVANGKVNVPDVRGMSLKDATAKLTSPTYMIPVITTGDRSCKSDASLGVGAQSVLGEAPLGTSVTLYYCAG
jgi:serine/threonine-protein kinase